MIYPDPKVQCAIISDIHGNLAALEAVLADIEKVGVKEVWCLGDVIGYGPQPIECFKLAVEKCSIIVRGNHEKALVTGASERFTARARRAIEWTRRPTLGSQIGEEVLDAVQKWPTFFERKDIMFTHGSPRAPTDEYLMPRDARNQTKMGAQFERMKRYAFVGHTHFPGVIEEGEAFVPPEDMLGGNLYMLEYEVKAIINVGSVGQPRDRNPKSCYVTFDGDSVVYRRVEYDASRTRKLIYMAKGLDDFLGDRLLEGK